MQPTQDALQLLFWSGVDGPDTGRPIAMEAVLERPEEIGLAFGLNGLIPLPPDQGGPVRALVPGWGGAASVKWLTEIRISSHRFWTRMHTREEALIGEQWPREEFDENEDEFLGATPEDIQGDGGTWQNTKSFLAFPYTYELSEPPGRYILAQGEVPKLRPGSARCAATPTRRSGSRRSSTASTAGAPGRRRRSSSRPACPTAASASSSPGTRLPGRTCSPRARPTSEGNVQPERVPLNQLGILCNAIAKFRVEVT